MSSTRELGDAVKEAFSLFLQNLLPLIRHLHLNSLHDTLFQIRHIDI
jgi:hypothetical protein